jgi:hypothetical protein
LPDRKRLTVETFKRGDFFGEGRGFLWKGEWWLGANLENVF